MQYLGLTILGSASIWMLVFDSGELRGLSALRLVCYEVIMLLILMMAVYSHVSV